MVSNSFSSSIDPFFPAMWALSQAYKHISKIMLLCVWLKWKSTCGCNTVFMLLLLIWLESSVSQTHLSFIYSILVFLGFVPIRIDPHILTHTYSLCVAAVGEG